jgi:hypothetical protein
VIRSIDPLGRAAYGVICITGMAGVAVPVLATAGVVAGITFWLDGEGGRALAVWLLSWAAAAFAALMFLVGAYIGWPFASDWITEWHGYAGGFATGGVGLALMALLVFATPVPLYLAVIVPLAAAFMAGFGVAGWLPGARTEAGKRRARPRLIRQR